MARCTHLLTASLLLASLSLAAAPAARAQHYYDHGDRYDHHGDEVGAAILGGIIGLGLGAAIAGSSQPPGYYVPPPGYYYPPEPYPGPGYAPPPPGYYGYDEPPY